MSRDIEFGVVVLTHGAPAPDEAFENEPGAKFRRVATTAEEHGFDVLMAGEGMAFAESMGDDTYLYTDDYEPPFRMEHPAYEVFNVLSHMAGLTTDIRLATNVVVVPYRRPVVLAKEALTLYTLCGGRFDFGVGVGSFPDEYEVVGVPFEERGSRTDEFLEMFHRAIEEKEFAFEGPHHSFPTAGFHPSPDEEGPPIWVGGFSDAAFERLARYGDGWTHYWTRGDLEDSSPGAMREWRERALESWKSHGREGEPEICTARPAYVGSPPSDRALRSELGPDPSIDAETPLVGAPGSIAQDIQQYVDAGVDRLNLSFQAPEYDIDLFIQQLEAFGDQVLAEYF